MQGWGQICLDSSDGWKWELLWTLTTSKAPVNTNKALGPSSFLLLVRLLLMRHKHISPQLTPGAFNISCVAAIHVRWRRGCGNLIYIYQQETNQHIYIYNYIYINRKPTNIFTFVPWRMLKAARFAGKVIVVKHRIPKPGCWEQPNLLPHLNHVKTARKAKL